MSPRPEASPQRIVSALRGLPPPILLYRVLMDTGRTLPARDIHDANTAI